MTGSALSGVFVGKKRPRADTRRSGGCLSQNRMSTDDTASNNSGGMSGRDDEQSDIERRAEWEAFEFSVPLAGRVRVQNNSYGDDSNEHEYVVAVEGGSAEWCTCPHHEHRDERCKHMSAVENQPAIMSAASASENEIEQARADGGTDTDTGTGADTDTDDSDEPESGDTRINDETGIPEVFVGEPDCPTAARSGWVIDPNRAEPVDHSEQRERAINLGIEVGPANDSVICR
jgi:hypothetical protein